MKPVKTKADFVRRYQANHFGNRAPTWDTLNEYLQDNYQGLVHIRNRVVGGPTWYDVKSEDVDLVWHRVVAMGHDQLYISGMAPTHLTLFQGEVQQSTNHIDLYYSQVRKPMRASLLEGGRQVSGILAIGLLRKYLCETSYDWLQTLLTEFEDHVIEFSTYATNWGTIPNVNTVFWEVRGEY